jgi:Protein of unknown function (DUF499)
VSVTHWADALGLRREVVEQHGHAYGLQMSLYEAVYQTSNVPYRDAGYWCDITQPTPKLVEFMAEIARHLAGASISGELYEGTRLFHLDQGMGGGKSHALVGLWHMAEHRAQFVGSEIGDRVLETAELRSGQDVEVGDTRTVVLCADNFSPGAARPEFGPATNLHQRFLWSLFKGDRRLYDSHVSSGTDKAAIKDAIKAVGRPVLILLDEVMDYAMALSGPDHRDTIPEEQAFLNSLTGAVAETPGVVMVVVMIRSDLDEQGYEGPAQDFRSYLGRRLERNGTSLSVNEPQDFGSIIRRRIFTRPSSDLPIAALAQRWTEQASTAWREHVFDRLPGARQLGTFRERLERSYPFHPDLLDLVERDWTQYAGFQRVRSTVEIFSASAFWWASEHAGGRRAPELIGVGDIPLHVAADRVLSSGVLHGNERQIIGMRQVAETDVTSSDRTDGQAVLVDERLTDGRSWVSVQPQPAVRMASALWMYSVAVRAQGRQGATKPELLAAVYVPEDVFGFVDAEEVFNALTDDEDERGLGSLDVIKSGGGSVPNRYVLVTHLNKRMLQRSALNRTTPELYDELVWQRVKKLASPGGRFNAVLPVEQPPSTRRDTALSDIFREIDQRRSNRLVVLDPRRWTLLNGRDGPTRSEIEAVLGLGPDRLGVDFAASCVIACVNTQRRDGMAKRARSAYAWQLATSEIAPDSDVYQEMVDETKSAIGQLDAEIKRTFQHYAYLIHDNDGLRPEFAKFEDDKSSLLGNDVWEEMAKKGEAVRSEAEGLSGGYLHKLLDLSVRSYTLAEVVEKFWRDPAFPLIPSESVARRAIFDALRPDEDGITWELVTSSGEQLQVASPDQLALNSPDQYLRLASGGGEVDDTSDGPGAQSGTGVVGVGSTGNGQTTPPVGGSTQPVRYRIHRMDVGNKSLTDVDTREKLFRLLSELADVVDPSSGRDVQVATIHVEINAAEGDLNEVKVKADQMGAVWSEHEEDF